MGERWSRSRSPRHRPRRRVPVGSAPLPRTPGYLPQPEPAGQRRDDLITGGAVAEVEWSDHGWTIPLGISASPFEATQARLDSVNRWIFAASSSITCSSSWQTGTRAGRSIRPPSPHSATRSCCQDDCVSYGPKDLDDFAICRGEPVTTAAHVAFSAEGRDAVDAFFAGAVANGATVRGEPGVYTQYSERYYAAFVNDLHQNNVEAVWHAPEPVSDRAPPSRCALTQSESSSRRLALGRVVPMSKVFLLACRAAQKSAALAELGRRGYRVVETDEPGWSEYRRVSLIPPTSCIEGSGSGSKNGSSICLLTKTVARSPLKGA